MNWPLMLRTGLGHHASLTQQNDMKRSSPLQTTARIPLVHWYVDVREIVQRSYLENSANGRLARRCPLQEHPPESLVASLRPDNGQRKPLGLNLPLGRSIEVTHLLQSMSEHM